MASTIISHGARDHASGHCNRHAVDHQQLVIMIKDSSLLLAIGFGELLYQAQQLYAANFRVTETLLIVGVMYFVAITILTWLANIVDRKVNR